MGALSYGSRVRMLMYQRYGTSVSYDQRDAALRRKIIEEDRISPEHLDAARRAGNG